MSKALRDAGGLVYFEHWAECVALVPAGCSSASTGHDGPPSHKQHHSACLYTPLYAPSFPHHSYSPSSSNGPSLGRGGAWPLTLPFHPPPASSHHTQPPRPHSTSGVWTYQQRPRRRYNSPYRPSPGCLSEARSPELPPLQYCNCAGPPLLR